MVHGPFNILAEFHDQLSVSFALLDVLVELGADTSLPHELNLLLDHYEIHLDPVHFVLPL